MHHIQYKTSDTGAANRHTSLKVTFDPQEALDSYMLTVIYESLGMKTHEKSIFPPPSDTQSVRQGGEKSNSAAVEAMRGNRRRCAA